MEKKLFGKTSAFNILLQQMPPLISESLINDSEFRDEYGILTDAIISIGTVTFIRSELYDAVRRSCSEEKDGLVKSTNGSMWELKYFNDNEQPAKIYFMNEKTSFYLPQLILLSPIEEMRVRYLNETLIPNNTSSKTWEKITAMRSLSDDEMDIFSDDIKNNPLSLTNLIYNEFEDGHSSIPILVPTSRKYYENLVGRFDGSRTIYEYSSNAISLLFEQCMSWNAYEGFLLSLYLSSHSSITAEVDIGKLNNHEIVAAFDYISEQGDWFSQLGAIEIGFRIFATIPEIEKYLIKMIKRILDNDDGTKLISALFMLVDGELSRLNLFSDTPPYYRRLASLAQASLIQRQINRVGLKSDPICDWALEHRWQHFFLQTYADMRTEPRWEPDYAIPEQIRYESIGRIIAAAANNTQYIKSGELLDLIQGSMDNSLQSYSKYPQLYLPGPLEGSKDIIPELPSEVANIIEIQLNTKDLTPAAFIAMVNSALLFRIDSNHAELAANLIRIGNHHLTNISDKGQLVAILYGLAMTASITENQILIGELKVLARKYRYDLQYPLSMGEIIKVCLVAASSYSNLADWRDFVGEWITELAFGLLKDDDAVELHSVLQYLCHIVPELWVSCGRADAALTALIDNIT